MSSAVGSVEGCPPGRRAVGLRQEAPYVPVKGFGVMSSSMPMVMDCCGCLNPAARAFGVSGLTHPQQSMRRPGRRGRGESD
jgi:hypothetical protein